MATILDGVAPADLGLPEKFSEYRDIQREIADYCLYGPSSDGDVRRFMAVGAPGGSGKSVAAHTIAAMCGVKTVILTATRALEDQNVRDGFRMVNVRGKANYECVDYDPLHPETKWSCDEGADRNCPRAETPFCTYGGRVQEAKEARVVVSNYSYWMHARMNNRAALESKKEPVGMLIADEAHLAFGQLASLLGAWVSNADLHRYADRPIRDVVRSTRGAESGRLDPTWTAALGEVRNGVWRRMSDIAQAYVTEAQAARGSKEYRALDKLSGNLGRILLHAESEAEEHKGKRQANWLWRMTRNGVSFDCIWPARYAERYLWSGVPRVVLMSATLRPKALALCGVRQSDYWFREWPSVFPVTDWPVYWVKTGRMGRSAGEDEKLLSVKRLDEIGDEWREYKGIVHSVSYPRAEWYQANSKWGRHMVLSKPGEQAVAAEKYRVAIAPCMLVSPSFSTGWDFPEEDFGYQVIPKLPFPDRSDPVLLARMEDDETYSDYVTMQTFAQSCMRKTRRAGQKCVTIVTDDSVGNFRRYAAVHAPRYLKVRDSAGVPKAPRGEGE